MRLPAINSFLRGLKAPAPLRILYFALRRFTVREVNLAYLDVKPGA